MLVPPTFPSTDAWPGQQFHPPVGNIPGDVVVIRALSASTHTRTHNTFLYALFIHTHTHTHFPPHHQRRGWRGNTEGSEVLLGDGGKAGTMGRGGTQYLTTLRDYQAVEAHYAGYRWENRRNSFTDKTCSYEQNTAISSK